MNDQKPTLTDQAQTLIALFQKPDETQIERVVETVKVSAAASIPALFYERIRNVIEYHEDHLLRRNAIERILERLLRNKVDNYAVSENLIKELIWAKYLPNETIPVTKIDEIAIVISSYRSVSQQAISGFGNIAQKKAQWLWSIASYDIERRLVETKKKEGIVNFMFQLANPQIKLVGRKISEEDKNIQVYIACHKALAKSDEAILRFLLLSFQLPNIGTDQNSQEKLSQNFDFYYTNIEKALNNDAVQVITRYLRKQIAPFLFLEDILRKYPGDDTVNDPKKLEEKITEICMTRYKELGARIRRAATRSIIYVFITKMFFAILIEIPIDRYLKEFRLMSLLINISVPPAMMFAFTLPVKAPGGKNTETVIKRIKGMLYQIKDQAELPLKPYEISLNPPHHGPVLTAILSLVYLATFIVTFGLILKILTILKFSLISKGVFILFLSAVAFFAYQIRQIAKDYTVSDHEGIFAPIVDFFMVPILYLGNLISKGLSRFNFFTFIFDIILEAPFKTIVKLLDEISRFLRQKREEMV